MLNNPWNCHPEEVAAATDEGSLYLLDLANAGILRGVYPERTAEILRAACPERNAEILRCAQDDKRRAQDDKRRAQNDTPKEFFSTLPRGVIS